jgi:hypothetical protein
MATTTDILTAYPPAALSAGGTLDFPYPDGKTADNYEPTGAAAFVNQSLLAQDAGFTLVYGTDHVTFTYTTGAPIAAGATVRLELPVVHPVLVDPDANITVKPHNGSGASYDGPATLEGDDIFVTLPADVAMVKSADLVPVKGPDGSFTMATGAAHVTDGILDYATMPAGSTVITNQAGGVVVQDAGGTKVNGSATIAANGQLSYVGMPGTAAICANGGATKIANSTGAGPVDGVFAVTGGFLTSVDLKLATDTIVSNGFSVDLGAVSVSNSGDDYATVNVASSAITNVGVSLVPTKTILQNGATIGLTSLVYNSGATAVVSGGALQSLNLAPNALFGNVTSTPVKTQGGGTSVDGTILLTAQGALDQTKLPANVSLVQNGVALTVPVTGTYATKITPQVDASGVITGFVLS